MHTLPAPLTRAVDAALEATVVLSFSKVGHAVRSRLDDWTPVTELPGQGRRIIVTGANSGLGYATARALLRSGARVLATVRSEDKAVDTRARLSADLGHALDDELQTDVLDLGDLASVRAFAQRRRDEDASLDAIVHNAGALFADKVLTGDGLEQTYQVHVVAPFLLTTLLLPTLAAGAPSRVITVTSGGMYAEKLVTARVDSPGGYRGSVAYARAKRAQVALTQQWQRRFGTAGIDFHVVHPGWALTPGVESSLPGFRKVTGPILRDADEGADTIVYLTLAEEVSVAGRLWHDRRPRGEHKVPWTRPERGEAGELWARVCRDAGVEPILPGVAA